MEFVVIIFKRKKKRQSVSGKGKYINDASDERW